MYEDSVQSCLEYKRENYQKCSVLCCVQLYATHMSSSFKWTSVYGLRIWCVFLGPVCRFLCVFFCWLWVSASLSVPSVACLPQSSKW